MLKALRIVVILGLSALLGTAVVELIFYVRLDPPIVFRNFRGEINAIGAIIGASAAGLVLLARAGSGR